MKEERGVYDMHIRPVRTLEGCARCTEGCTKIVLCEGCAVRICEGVRGLRRGCVEGGWLHCKGFV